MVEEKKYFLGLRVKGGTEHMTIAWLDTNRPECSVLKRENDSVRIAVGSTKVWFPKFTDTLISGLVMLGPNNDVKAAKLNLPNWLGLSCHAVWATHNVEQEHTKHLKHALYHVTIKKGGYLDSLLEQKQFYLQFDQFFLKEVGGPVHFSCDL